MSIDDIRPAAVPGLPDVNWGEEPATPERLYQEYGNDIAAATIQALQRIRADEPEITRMLITAASGSGARMPDELLAWRVKSPQSLARKIDKKTAGPAGDESAANIAGRLTDVVRYTAIVDRHEEIASRASAMVADLNRRGWQIVEAEQSYVAGNPYKGLHMLARTPSGQVIELQVHSVASQAIKDRQHVDYETERDDSQPIAERAAAHARMVAAWAAAPPPPGLDGLVLGGIAVVRKPYPNRYLRRPERRDDQ